MKLKVGKATGYDNIPAKPLKIKNWGICTVLPITMYYK